MCNSKLYQHKDMKRIDRRTERRLYWLFVPMGLVVVWLIAYLWFGVNLLDRCFGVDVDVLDWCSPALLGSMVIVFVGFGIAAFKQKCWGELTIAFVVAIIALLNMNDVFTDLLFP